MNVFIVKYISLIRDKFKKKKKNKATPPNSDMVKLGNFSQPLLTLPPHATPNLLNFARFLILNVACGFRTSPLIMVPMDFRENFDLYGKQERKSLPVGDRGLRSFFCI